MTNAQIKKAQELAWLQDFIKCRGKKITPMQIIPGESPDFILFNNKKRISVELTALINEEIKASESLKNKIVEQAKGKFEHFYPKGLHVDIGFTEGKLECRSNQINEYVNQIGELVAHVFDKNNVASITNYARFEELFEQKLITSITLFPNQKNSYWSTGHSYAFPHIQTDKIISIVKIKEKILSGYANSFNQNWLLLITNLCEESSSFDFSGIKKNLSLQTSFHQVFIFQVMEKRFIRLK